MIKNNPNPVVNAIKNVQDAVVSIMVSKEIPEELLSYLPIAGPGGIPMPQAPQTQKGGLPQDHQKVQVGGGSGFVVSPEGLILTNKHVVRDPTAIYSVVFADDKVLPARVLSRDPINDIAVLKVEPEGKLSTADLGDSSNLSLGETLIAIGNALGTFKNTVSVGVVSGLSRFLTAHDSMAGSAAHLRGLIQTDAAINPGNSGGPLINDRGETIGINVATVMGAENIGFAIPINSAKKDLDDIKKYGHIRKPFLGVRYLILNQDIKKQFRLPTEAGAYVIKEPVPGDHAVVPGSPAAKAGLQEKDIIIKFNNSVITEKNTLQDILEDCEVGQTVPLVFMRDGKEKTTKMQLEERK